MRDYGGRDTATVDLLLLAGCVAVALIAYALPRPWASGVVAGLRQTALLPVVALHERASRDRASRFELDAVIAGRDSLALVVLSGSAMRRENAELREILHLGERFSTSWRPASVLHRPTPTDARTLSLSIGSNDGVQQFDPVITPAGLVGYIWSASASTSVVLTWMHPDFGASAVTGNGGVLGLLQTVTIGSLGHPFLELGGVALSDTLAVGQSVYTSGLGGVYPQAIPVGTVVGVEPDPLGYERFYRVAPFVNPGAASHVMVLITPRDTLPLPFEMKDSVP